MPIQWVPTIRHNHLRDMTSELMSEVCPSVVSEPQLQALSGEQLPTSCNRNDDARADIKAHGFWNRYEDAFFDIRVFYPFAPSYQTSSLPALYRKQEKQKKREYGKRIREVERGSFTPLVLTTGGGMVPEATVFYKRLASLLSETQNETYPVVMGWLRCVVSFCLLRSALACLRGSSKSKRIQIDSITEAVTSGRQQCRPVVDSFKISNTLLHMQFSYFTITSSFNSFFKTNLCCVQLFVCFHFFEPILCHVFLRSLNFKIKPSLSYY